MKIFKNLLVAFIVAMPIASFAQKAQQEKMQWFEDAKLGIFIHWGIYAVNGISESWSFFNGYINYTDYRNQVYC